MTRHIRGGHVSFWLGSTNNITKPSQIRRAQRNAGSHHICIYCKKTCINVEDVLIHQKVCEYRDPATWGQLRIRQRREARLEAIYDWFYDVYMAIRSFIKDTIFRSPKPFVVGPQPKTYTSAHRLLDSEREKVL